MPAKKEVIELKAIWNECGKYFASSKIEDNKIKNFWDKIEELGVWKWHKKYPYWKQKYEQLPDGCDWKLKLRDRNGWTQEQLAVIIFIKFKDLIKELNNLFGSKIEF